MGGEGGGGNGEKVWGKRVEHLNLIYIIATLNSVLISVQNIYCITYILYILYNVINVRLLSVFKMPKTVDIYGDRYVKRFKEYCNGNIHVSATVTWFEKRGLRLDLKDRRGIRKDKNAEAGRLHQSWWHRPYDENSFPPPFPRSLRLDPAMVQTKFDIQRKKEKEEKKTTFSFRNNSQKKLLEHMTYSIQVIIQ